MQICHGILIPMLFFMFNELARKHFWEELAPEWLHFLNPDRVHEVNYWSIFYCFIKNIFVLGGVHKLPRPKIMIFWWSVCPNRQMSSFWKWSIKTTSSFGKWSLTRVENTSDFLVSTNSCITRCDHRIDTPFTKIAM